MNYLTVGELKELLNQYGDHLPIVILYDVDDDGNDMIADIDPQIETTEQNYETCVTLFILKRESQ